MRLVIAICFCAFWFARSAGAQTPPGKYGYVVTGVAEGEEMAPWRSVTTLSDTVIAGHRTLGVRYQSRESLNGFLFDYTTFLNAGGVVGMTRWVGMSHRPATCTVQITDGSAAGTLNEGQVLTSRRLSGPAVPEFAAASYVALQRLADGDTIRFTSIRCLPFRGAEAIDVHLFAGVVKSDVTNRAGPASAEPTWVITGDSAYPLVLVLAKRDLVPLRIEVPQGTVGHSTETFDGSRH